jgi:hypothetical protein
LVGAFYLTSHGSNYQPAFQAAINDAAQRGKKVVLNDLGPILMEMWCPVRTTPFRTRTEFMAADGVPLLVTQSMEIDFAGATIDLKGPGGGDRMLGQKMPNNTETWIGGWLYVIGHKLFDRLVIKNVIVEGHFKGDVNTNKEANLTDKGFRLQDTYVGEVILQNVELRNFAAEIYYVGGLGPDLQIIENCHFHGSPQCAFNPGGIGQVIAKNLKAGRAYQAAEVIGGKGHRYIGGEFYQAGLGGNTFFGGPAPGFKSGYPYWYPFWDGNGPKPLIAFEDTIFRDCGSLRVGSWVSGKIQLIDTEFIPLHSIGHLQDIDLDISSMCDQHGGFAAAVFDGPRDLVTQVPGTPPGTFVEPPADVRIRITCLRSNAARANGRRHAAAARFYGGLVDAQSFNLEVTGEAALASELFGVAAIGFEMPQCKLNGFMNV